MTWQIYENINVYDSNFDNYVNLNLHTCHCTIHRVTDGTYSKAHPYTDSCGACITLQNVIMIFILK